MLNNDLIFELAPAEVTNAIAEYLLSRGKIAEATYDIHWEINVNPFTNRAESITIRLKPLPENGV